MQVLTIESQLGTMRKMSKIAGHVMMDYFEILVYRFEAQPVNEIFCLAQEEESVKNSALTEHYEGLLSHRPH